MGGRGGEKQGVDKEMYFSFSLLRCWLKKKTTNKRRENKASRFLNHEKYKNSDLQAEVVFWGFVGFFLVAVWFWFLCFFFLLFFFPYGFRQRPSGWESFSVVISALVLLPKCGLILSCLKVQSLNLLVLVAFC